MRRYGLAVTLLAAVALTASSAWALVPHPTHCEVDSATIAACPYADHTVDGMRFADVEVTLYTEDDVAVPDFPSSRFQFFFAPHSAYPELGGGAQGDCANCDDHFTAECQSDSTDALGKMVVRITVGPDCAPSMTCPVEMTVNLIDVGYIPYPVEVLQNSHDLVPNGDVRSPDFGAFSTAYNEWGNNQVPTPAADFVYSVGQGQWGEVGPPDFGAFSTHYRDCCGVIKANDPGECDPWTNPCP